MTPRQYLKTYTYDPRQVTGRYYPTDALSVEPGDTIGVVLFHLGGPDAADSVRPFLYNLFMDPVLLDLPGGGIARPWLSRAIASLRAKSVRKEYEAIGGGSPVNRLADEQAESLEALLYGIWMICCTTKQRGCTSRSPNGNQMSQIQLGERDVRCTTH